MPLGANLDAHTEFKAVSAIAPDGNRTTTQTSAAIDTQGYGTVTFVVDYAVITDGTFTPKITECDTSNGVFTDVAADDVVGTLTAGTSTVDERTVKFSYRGTKRYVKLVLTASGSPLTGGKFSAMAILGRPASAPVA